MTWRGPEARGAAHEAAGRGLESAAAHVLARSQEVVPFEKGDLSRSGASGMTGDLQAAVTYTDRGAVDAHERMDVTPANGRQRKYLEVPLNASREQVARIVADHIRKALG